jgi:formylglycine-generating enzyme required for sulfatase activity
VGPPEIGSRVAKPPAITNSIGMKFVPIPAGIFLMGSPENEKERYHDEDLHEVEITRSFHLGAYEVTQEQYRKVTGKSPSYFSATGMGKGRVKGLDTRNFPVEMVSWHEARAFCDKLSALPAEKAAKRRYRLPTEAEWELSCRQDTDAPEPAPFHFGNSLSVTQANFDGQHPYGKAAAGRGLNRPTFVGSYKPSGVGLYDMHGNVWEWCEDWYDEDYYKTSPRKDPTGPAKGNGRLLRGGSYYVHARLCRTAHRQWATPGTRHGYIGFRVVCVPAR